jgi:mitochondrial intermembrane space import and assembly protein 40
LAADAFSEPSSIPTSVAPTTSPSKTLSDSETPKTVPDGSSGEKHGADDDSEGGEGEGDGSSQAAFDPVTGKINWDCPCLGGMAYGPCGMQFREAFSCFVFSEEEPKGIDCVEKFKAMQQCFRDNPEVYGEGELTI